MGAGVHRSGDPPPRPVPLPSTAAAVDGFRYPPVEASIAPGVPRLRRSLHDLVWITARACYAQHWWNGIGMSHGSRSAIPQRPNRELFFEVKESRSISTRECKQAYRRSVGSPAHEMLHNCNYEVSLQQDCLMSAQLHVSHSVHCVTRGRPHEGHEYLNALTRGSLDGTITATSRRFPSTIKPKASAAATVYQKVSESS
nr:hypothetical protein CFP56_69069 [Quercus suber]